MKALFLALAAVLMSAAGFAQAASSLSARPDPAKKLMVVDASCGECNFGMEGDNCDLAIALNGKYYFVDGVGIKDYGGPHDKGGFCVAVRRAEVQGEVVNGRFKASYFKLLDEQGGKGKKGK